MDAAAVSVAHDLDAFVHTLRGREFWWGRHDCATMAAEWVHLREGVDPRAGSTWAGLRGARRYIAARGQTLREAVGQLLARQEIPPAQAQVGDVVLITGTVGIGEALGICAGRHVICIGEQGPCAVDMAGAVCAWPIAR